MGLAQAKLHNLAGSGFPIIKCILLLHGVEAANLAFLQKPFLPDDLVREVREVLDGSPRNEQH